MVTGGKEGKKKLAYIICINKKQWKTKWCSNKSYWEKDFSHGCIWMICDLIIEGIKMIKKKK